MERFRYRSTSLLELQAELRRQELLDDARQRPVEPGPRRARSLPFGLRRLRIRLAR